MITKDPTGAPLVQEGGLADERISERMTEVSEALGVTMDESVKDELFNLLAHYMLEDTETDYTDEAACAVDPDDGDPPQLTLVE